jgi:hypothetical protein
VPFPGPYTRRVILVVVGHQRRLAGRSPCMRPRTRHRASASGSDRSARRVRRRRAGREGALLLGGALVEVERIAPGVVAERRQLLLLLPPPPRAAATALGHDLLRHGLPAQLGARRPRVLRGAPLLALLRLLLLQPPVLQPARRRRPRQRAAEAAEALRHQLLVARRHRPRRHGRLVHEAGHGNRTTSASRRKRGR